MMINNVKNKINEQRGASLAMALFAMIVVIVVSTLILSSALSNIGRVRRNQQAEQNYLTVSSAAKLVEDCLSGMEITYNDVSVDGNDTGFDYPQKNREIKFKSKYGENTSAVNPFKKNFENWFDENKEKSEPKEFVYLIKADDGYADILEDTAVIINIDGVKGENGQGFGGIAGRDGEIGTVPLNISCEFMLNKKKDSYILNMTLPSTCRAQISTHDEEVTLDDDTKVTRTVTEKSYSFLGGSNAKILRGGTEKDSTEK